MPNLTTDKEARLAAALIMTARNYYDGEQKVYLTDRQKAWLALHTEAGLKFFVNHCATVVDTKVERLKVVGFALPDGKPATTLWDWWDASRMDAMQIEIHRKAAVDGETFVLIDWNEEENRPEFILHPRYVDKQAGGDGYGIWVEYPQNNPYLRPTRAFKRWEEMDGNGDLRQRMTIYYPDRIEKYFLKEGWQKLIEGDEGTWPVPWVGAGDKPLGIPVAHYRNPGQRSDLKFVIPLQDALNKVWLDILAAVDSSGFQSVVTFGWLPTTDGAEPKTDGSNLLKVAPGQWVGTKKTPAEAGIHVIDPAKLGELLNSEERLVLRIAEVGKTPPSRFVVSRQIAAEGTLKEQDGPLIAKVEECQTLYGNAYEDMMLQAARQSQAFGQGDAPMELEAGKISTLWQDAQARHEDQELQNAERKQKLRVPTTRIWKELGYTEEEIIEMQKSPEYLAFATSLEQITSGGDNLNG